MVDKVKVVEDSPQATSDDRSVPSGGAQKFTTYSLETRGIPGSTGALHIKASAHFTLREPARQV